MGLLTDLQNAIRTRLQGSALFTGPPTVTVICENDGDIDVALQKYLQDLPLGVLVVTDKATIKSGYVTEQEVRVVIQERPIINRGSDPAGPAAADVAIDVVARLNQWDPGDQWGALQARSKEMVQPEAKGTIMYEVVFDVPIQLRA